MGKSRRTTTSSSESSSQTTVTPTPEEKELNKLGLDLRKNTQEGLLGLQPAALQLGQALVTGEGLPGFFQGLPGGISPEVTADIARESVSDIQPFFQKSGLVDSGVNAAVSGQVAGDVRRQSAQFNLQLLQNLLSQALTGQAAVQQPIIGFEQLLSQRLAGLRNKTVTGSSQSETISPKQGLFGLNTSVGFSAGPFGVKTKF